MEEILNTTIDIDSEQLGCSPFDRLYQAGILGLFVYLTKEIYDNNFYRSK